MKRLSFAYTALRRCEQNLSLDKPEHGPRPSDAAVQGTVPSVVVSRA